MDREIEALLENSRTIRGEERTLTREERERWGHVHYEVLQRGLSNFFPGEVPHIESIDPADGTIIFFDSYGRQTLPIQTLGYRPPASAEEMERVFL